MTPIVLLINPETERGGIETLILRKARWYRGHGYRPIVLAVFRGNMHDELTAAGAAVWYSYVPLGRSMTERAPEIASFATRTRRALGRTAKAVCFVEAFGPAAAMLGERLATELGVPCVTGVFHPDAYYVGGFDGTALLRSAMQRESLYFMNEAVRAAHARRAGDLSGATFPLMLDVDKPNLYQPRENGLALLSVGRLVAFKTYNLYMLDLVAAMRGQYPNITYTVIGSGPLEPALRTRIAELGLADCVKLIAEWPYARLSELVSRYDLHIGMGTTVLDLALYGLPSLVAVVDDQQARSPGFVHEDVGNTGETYGTQPRPAADLLAEFAAYSAAERLAMSQAGVAAVQAQYSIDELMPRFVSFAGAGRTPHTLSDFRSVGARDGNYQDYLYWRFRRDFYGVWKRYRGGRAGASHAARH